MKRIAIILSLILVASSCDEQKTLTYYTASVTKIANEAGIPSLTLRYTKRNKAIQISVPAKTDSPERVYQAASLSKPVFAYIVLKMAENNEIDLDKPIAEYTDIDRFENKEWASLITPRMVLTHRSGLPDWCAPPSSDEWVTSPIFFSFRPDSCFGYSGEAFAFLQRAVEKILGKDIQQIAQERVFIPFDMPNTSYQWEPEYASTAVDGYNREGENRGPGTFTRQNVAYTLRTTASDYTKFLKVIMDYPTIHNVPSDTEPAKYYLDRVRDADQHIFWGLGVGTEVNPQFGKVIWHWGDNGNYKCLFLIIPSKNSTLVYFTNSAKGHDIIDQILPIFFKNKKPFAISSWIND